MKITDLEDGIIDAIAEAKNKKRIPDSVPKGQRRSDYVKDFQEMLCKCIREKESFSMLNPSTEKHIFEELGDADYSQIGDRADVYVDDDDYEVIIEIDATRADQVAKKMVSRVSYHLLNRRASYKKLIYISLLYQGTDNMNIDECKKYFIFENLIITTLDRDSSFIGYIMGKDNDYVFRPRLNDSFDLDKVLEKLKVDAYTDFLYANHPDNSAYQYLRAITIIKDYIATTKQVDIEQSIDNCLNLWEQKLVTCKDKKGIHRLKNERSYLRSYKRWWKTNNQKS